MSDLALSLVSRIAWDDYVSAAALPSTRVRDALELLLTSGSSDEATAAWIGGIEDYVFSSGDLFPVAEPTTLVLVASLIEPQPVWRSSRIFDALFLIVTAWPGSDPELSARCRAAVRDGSWLLIRWALTDLNPDKDAALEIVDEVNPGLLEALGLGSAS